MTMATTTTKIPNILVIKSWDERRKKAKLRMYMNRINTSENTEQQELSYIAAEKAKRYNHIGRESGSFL